MKEKADVLQFPNAIVPCPSCGGTAVTTDYKALQFDYGRPPQQVRLSANVPVHTCNDCSFSFAGDEAEISMHEAVCRHLGVLTPREVRGIRESLMMSRAEFAKLTRFGDASLARWESGALIQNGANDQLLYLLRFTDNLLRLRSRSDREHLAAATSPAGSRFRSLSNLDSVRRAAANFALRKASF